jgi:hypothetical protein
MNTKQFHHFFECCVGQWRSERTYHYLLHDEVERSHTEFQVNPLTPPLKEKVFSDNQYPVVPNLEDIPGFQLAFHTVSETGEEVSQELNLLFVPTQEQNGILTGDYLRDRAYEEARPIISHFRFIADTQELLMTTNYTRVVSVDSITLINPTLRMRRILNYQRPPEGESLEQVRLAGFGVEKKLD